MRYIVSLFMFISIFGKFLSPNDPIAINLQKKLLSPSFKYFLGTDYLGRCIFSRIILGIQVTFLTALIVTILSALLGMCLGVIAGNCNRRIENIIIRITDIFDSFPSIIIVLLIVNIMGSSAFSLGLSLLLVSWTNYSRISRNLTKELMSSEFIIMSTLLNKPKWRILKEDLIPNITPQIMIVAFNSFAGVILSLAGYSFLGFGVRAPYSELGMMINEGKDYIYSRPELMIGPGVVIFIMVISVNLLGNEIKNQYEIIKD
ncbi:ABC transporter permease subunit [Fusobacterium sp. SYSU M8D902]|uniref:ABC transporter permease n=1 Tax=Fusobacterium sp. SYSU M8D902 TaxID=3159562 RepID=UPI0032E474E3